jgi:hypothetical protein
MQQDTAVGIRVNPGRKNTVKLSTVPAPHVFARMGAHTNLCARAHTHTHTFTPIHADLICWISASCTCLLTAARDDVYMVKRTRRGVRLRVGGVEKWRGARRKGNKGDKTGSKRETGGEVVAGALAAMAR